MKKYDEGDISKVMRKKLAPKQRNKGTYRQPSLRRGIKQKPHNRKD